MSEKKLWNELRNGQKSALETIYRQYFSELYTYGKRFSIDQNTIEDAIQELFVELWERREHLSQTDKIKPYLLISLKRKIFHKAKLSKKLNETEARETHFEVELAVEQRIISTEQTLETRNSLQEAFEQLSARQKEILYLKYYSGLDYDEITEVMDMNYQSARNLVSRALLKLSKYLTVIIIMLALAGSL